MNWGQAKSTATGYIHRRDIDWDMVQPLANDDIAQRILVQDLEGAITLDPAILPGSPFYYADVPVDFARARSVTYSNGAGDMQGVPSKTFRARLCGPDSYTIQGNRLWAYSAKPVELVYTARLPIMVADSDTNAVLFAYSTVYIYGLLKHGSVLATDFDSSDKFEAMFDRAIGEANENYTLATMATGLMPMVQGGIV